MVKKKKEIQITDDTDLIVSAIEEIGANVMTSLDDLKVGFYISTGMWGFDWALGQGIPNISVIEVHGPNTIGKTSLALHIINQAVRQGMTAYYVDMEYAVNDKQAAIFLDNKDSVRWIQPESGEKALDIIKLILRTTKNSFIVLDSVGSSQPEKIAEGDVGASHMGVQARMFMQFGPVAKVWTRKNGNILFAINQESSKILPSGQPAIALAGGRKWEYVPDIRFRLTKKFQNGTIKNGEDIIGHIVEAKITKNRFGAPFRTAEMPLIYGVGFDVERELVDNAVDLGVVRRSGAWYNYGEVRLGQGIGNSSNFLKENTEILDKIRKELNEIVS